MSQIYKSSAAGPAPPTSLTQITNDDGTIAIPAANNLFLHVEDSTENNDNGIVSRANPDMSDDEYILLTNRATGQETTTNTDLTDIITFPLADNTVYSMTGYVTARDTGTGDGASYFFDAAFSRFGGAGAHEIGTEYPTTFEDAAFVAADIFVIPSGNNVVVQVQGIASTVNWDAYLTYRQV